MSTISWSPSVWGEGKLRWIVGGEDGTDEPKLAKAFFLGAPLPLMGRLYVLAEVNGEIRLVVLDADSGPIGVGSATRACSTRGRSWSIRVGASPELHRLSPTEC